MTGDRVLVVGGTGRVGAAVVRMMVAAGHDAVSAGRSGAVHLDHDRPATYRAALDGVRSLFAATPDRPDSAEIETRLFAAAADAGVEKVVKLSAASAGWQPPASFGVAHRMSEQTLLDTALTTVVLRPTVFQETIAMFTADVAKGRMVVPRCTGRIAFVAVDDVAAVATAALTTDRLDGRILELTGPEAFGFDDVAAMVGSIVGRPVHHRSIPRPIARRLLPRIAGMSRWRADQIVSLFAGLHKGLQAEVTDDVERSCGRPATNLAERLADLVP